MGKLYVIGVGSGNYEDITIKANNKLNSSDLIYCDERLYEKIKHHFESKKIVGNSYNATFERCLNAIESAKYGKIVSILGSGDTGVYGISSIILEQTATLTSDVEVEIIPGITSALSGAALLGAPLMQDFAIITLSDNLADIKKMKERIISAAKSDFVIVFYSPCNPTYSNLILAKEILLSFRSPKTVVGIVKDIGEETMELIITELKDLSIEKISLNTTIFVGNESTYFSKTKKMITPLE